MNNTNSTPIPSTSPPMDAITNHTIIPPFKMHYKNGDIELDLAAIYRNIKDLGSHRGRGRLGFNYSPDGQQMIVHQCSDEFIDSFWVACANLLDYFADFLSTDTHKNQIIWFHMLDMLQEAARLPHNTFSNLPHCDHAASFAEDYEQTLKLMNQVISGDKWEEKEDMVHGIIGLTEPASFRTGPWKNGLKPWQQFLMRDSPGFAVPKNDREYPEGVEAPKVCPPKGCEGTEKVVERCVPSGALAIIQKHTERARILAEHYAQYEDNINQEDFLAEFDARSFNPDQVGKYTTLTGQSLTATPFHPSSNARTAPHRIEGWYDPSCLMTNPTFWMLDEAIANYKGNLPMVHPGGEDQTWMMDVREHTSGGTEDEERSEVQKKVLGHVWDNWAVEELD